MSEVGAPKAVGRISVEPRGPISIITIDNEARRNAISLKMWRELDAALAGIDGDTRCILVRGAGHKAFASGADISEFGERRRAPEDVAAYDEAADSAMARLHAMAQPTVAAISGFCIGGGVALALCCDVRIAAQDSQIAIPAGRLGLGYSPASIAKLLHTVSPSAALDILMSARRFSAVEALAVGLVNRVHPTDTIFGEADAYVAAIADNAPLTVRAAKRTVRELAPTNAKADHALCEALVAQCFASEDYLEGIRAFAEKRAPQFKGS